MPSPTLSGQKQFEVGDFNLDEPSWAPTGFIHVQWERWRLSAGGFSFATGDQEAPMGQSGVIGSLSLAAGDQTRSSLDFWSAEFEGAYRLIHKPMGTMENSGPRLVFGLEPLAGVRMYNADFEINALSGVSAGIQTKADDFFVEPILGIKLEAEFAEQFTVDLQTDFGIGPWGDTSSWSWDIMVGGAWRPIPNLGIRVGYRHLRFDLESGSGSEEFRFDGSMAGLFAGIEIRF